MRRRQRSAWGQWGRAVSVPGEGLRQVWCGFLDADWRGGRDAAAPSDSLAGSWQQEEHSGRAACG